MLCLYLQAPFAACRTFTAGWYRPTATFQKPSAAYGLMLNIAPVRREMLCNLRCYVCLDADADLEDRIRRGLKGEFNASRYGVPFLGDNQFLLDRLQIEPDDRRRPAHWYEVITEASGSRPRPHTTRLTVSINRADMSQTVSRLFAPQEAPALMPPESAWVEVGQSVNQERGRNHFPKWNKVR